jgi:arylsulfatase A-like enzyme
VQADGAADSIAEIRPGSLLALALWVGIVTGFAEVVKVGTDLFYSDFSNRSRDFLWMTPAFDAAVFLLVGAVLAGIVALRVRLSWFVAAGLFAGFGATLVFLLVQRLHPLAAVVLGAGVGVQLGRLTRTRIPAARAMVRRSLPWLGAAVVVLCVTSVGWQALADRRRARTRPAAAPGQPNVLLLILDTVRAADLSLYGYPRNTTPELAAFATRATVFDRAFSVVSWTLPSHASLFTGEWEYDLGVDWWNGLDEHWPTLAEVLRARGYGTGAFIANTGYLAWDSGLTQGFERYDDYDRTLWTAALGTALGRVVYPDLRRALRERLADLPVLWRVPWPHPNRHRSAEQISNAFLAWVDQDRPRPFFAFLNLMDAHTPYTAPDSFRFRFRSPLARPVSPFAWMDDPPVRLTPADVRPKQDMYDGSIAYLDSELGRLFRELERRGLLEHTLVIIAGDHGEEFAEHGVVDHGHTLYRFSVQVPLIVSFPGHVPAGRRVSEPATLRNVAATVLDLVGVPGPTPMPGRSLARFWTPGADTTADRIVTSLARPDGRLLSIVVGDWRYIRHDHPEADELYDFKHDVLERWNLVGTDTGRALLPGFKAALSALRNESARAELSGREPGHGRFRTSAP